MTNDAYLVLRYKRLIRSALAGLERHGRREGEDLDHVDPSRTHLNEFLVGSADLCADVDRRLAQMMRDNAERRIAKLLKSRHRKDADVLADMLDAAGDDLRELSEITGWPWDHKQTMPYTEGLLSISSQWFGGESGAWDEQKVGQFRSFALDYLRETFGSDLIYARMDMDEKTPHIHYVVLPEFEERRTGKRMLSHHQHRHFGREELASALFDGEEPDPRKVRRSYEILQDEVAAFARARGLEVERGAKRAELNRLLRDLGEEVERREHVTPAKGREIATAKLGEAEELRKQAEATRRSAAKAVAATEADRAASAEALRRAEEDREAATSARETADADRAASAETLRAAGKDLEAARAERAAAAAFQMGVVVGTQALLEEEIAYRPAEDERAEGLRWGRRAPAERERRDWLMRTVRPATELLVKFAKRLWQVTQRETEAAEREAKLRRQAAVLSAAERRSGREGSAAVDLIAAGQGSSLFEHEAYPGAWHIQPEQRRELVDAWIDQADNRALGQAWNATLDALRLTDKGSVLHRTFAHSAEEIERHAAARGYDLEAGTHDPGRARDPQRAMLHRDEDALSIRVTRRDRACVRMHSD